MKEAEKKRGINILVKSYTILVREMTETAFKFSTKNACKFCKLALIVDSSIYNLDNTDFEIKMQLLITTIC